MGSLGHEILRAGVHGLAQGGISAVNGGDFGQGFASGALGSLGGEAFKAFGGEFANSLVGIVGFASISGGIGAELTGGNFWEGAATGAIIGLLNAGAHRGQKALTAWFGSNFIGPGLYDCDPYEIKDEKGNPLIPIDEVDKAARDHDRAYYLARTGGVKGALLDLAVARADRALFFSATRTIIKYGLGLSDNQTNKKITFATYLRAQAVASSFGPISGYKTTFNTVLYLSPNR